MSAERAAPVDDQEGVMLVVGIAVAWIVLSVPVALLVGRCLALNDEAFFGDDERRTQPHDIHDLLGEAAGRVPTRAHHATMAAAAIAAVRGPVV